MAAALRDAHSRPPHRREVTDAATRGISCRSARRARAHSADSAACPASSSRVCRAPEIAAILSKTF